ncbi:MAG: ATP-binding protein [Rhizobiaceae bacterium]
MTTIWTFLALLGTGLILSTVFRTNAQRDFERLLHAHAFNLMGSFDVDDAGQVTGAPNMGDPRFETPLSGWYWSVIVADKPAKLLLHSGSISGDVTDMPPPVRKPFDDRFQRVSEVTNTMGHRIRQLEAQLLLGEGDTLFQVLVAGNTLDIEEAVSSFNRTLALFFVLFGAGTILATHFVIRIGLRPLAAATDALHDVREGHREKLDGVYPVEIQPLAGEINALIDTNRSIVDRARTQVGNLAHALKTPLAVIVNEVRGSKQDQANLIGEQAELMKSQVQTYLDRARIAAQRDVIVSRTPVLPVLTKLVRVMQRLSPDVQFEVAECDPQIAFRGEEQDLEEIFGNLMENASRFAANSVRVRVAEQPFEQTVAAGTAQQMRIEIEDDGPGLSEDERKKAVKRGIRLDESQPGSGLGLSIVRDIATEYGGDFKLEKGELGGLKAVIILPKLSVSSNATSK